MGKHLNDAELKEYVQTILSNPETTYEDKLELMDLIEQRKKYRKYNALEFYEPHEWQRKFLDAGSKHRYRFLSCANRVGKSLTTTFELAAHLSGRYDEDWKGKRFFKPIHAWAVGVTADQTRSVLQKLLIGTANVKGDVSNLDEFGTGAIPKDCIIIDSMQKDGARLESVRIKHYNKYGEYDGDSTLEFKSCSQGAESLRGATLDCVLLDETPPKEALLYYGELHARVRTTKGIVLISATPEDGWTTLVEKFANSEAKEEYFQIAGIYDSPLYTDEEREQMILETPEYLRPAKLFGSPKAASGAVFPYDFDKMIVEPFTLPNDWLYCAALDLGWTDPTVCTWVAMSPEKVFYVYDTYAKAEDVPAVHAQAIKARGARIPLVLPHDSLKKEAGTGQMLYDMYKELLPDQVQKDIFYNKKDIFGNTNNSRRDGFDLMRVIMREDRLKFFPNCNETIKQLKNYRAINGKVQEKGGDDFVDSLRYALLSCENRGAPKTGENYFDRSSHNRVERKPYNPFV